MSIKVENLRKSFGAKLIFDNLNLEFESGETTAILGHSGSGKSTLLRSLNLLEIPQSGKLSIKEHSIDFSKKIDSTKIRAIRAHTTMVFQHFNLFAHLTAKENITKPLRLVKKIPTSKADELALALLEKVGLKEYAKHYPAMLSGGQAQRVAIARALAFEPDFLLLDEPTTALDPSLTNEVLKVIEALSKENKSIILVTHNLEFAKNCADKIVLLEQGKVLFDGSKASFFASNEIGRASCRERV